MFKRNRIQYIYGWTIPAKTWPELRPEFNEFAGTSLRAVRLGVVVAASNYALTKLILPELQPPPLMTLLIVVGGMVAFGVLFSVAMRFSSEQQKWGISERGVHKLPNGGAMPFNVCQAWVLHRLSNRMELFSKAGDILIVDLPQDAVMREQVVQFIQSRVRPWLHPTAPSDLRVSAGNIEGRSLSLLWALMLLGSLLIGSSAEVAKFAKSENFGYYLFFGYYFFGPGYIWGWNAWKKLSLFPLKKRLDIAFHLSLPGNMLFNLLLAQFLLVFDTARIAP